MSDSALYHARRAFGDWDVLNRKSFLIWRKAPANELKRGQMPSSHTFEPRWQQGKLRFEHRGEREIS